MTRRAIAHRTTRRKPSGQLPALYVGAAKALAEITRIDEAKKLRDEATAFAVYYQQANDSAMVERATEVRYRAETRCGELLIEMDADGRRASRSDNLKRGPRTDTVSGREKPKLIDLGISEKQSSRWQALARQKRTAPTLWEQQLQRRCRIAAAVTEGDRAVLAEMNEERHRNAKTKRDLNEQGLADKIKALPGKKHGVVLADPPWRFETWSEKGMTNTNPANHYPTSDIQEIIDLPINRVAAPDCVLFLWATTPALDQAIAVMTAWGFVYRSHFVWAKNRIVTGYWVRSRHELLLIGVRGRLPAPILGTQYESVIEAPLGRHSAKPEKFLEMIEQMFPTLPKIELYRRGPARSGWSAWGAEAITND